MQSGRGDLVRSSAPGTQRTAASSAERNISQKKLDRAVREVTAIIRASRGLDLASAHHQDIDGLVDVAESIVGDRDVAATLVNKVLDRH